MLCCAELGYAGSQRLQAWQGAHEVKAVLLEVANTFEELLGAGADAQAKDKEVQVLISQDNAKVFSRTVRLEVIIALNQKAFCNGARKSARLHYATPVCDAQSQCLIAVGCPHVPLSQLMMRLQGKNALMYACEGGQVPIVRHLMRFNAAADAKDNQVL